LTLGHFLIEELRRGLNYFLFKGECLLCGAFLVKRAENLICDDCRRELVRYNGYFCQCCGRFSSCPVILCADCAVNNKPYLYHRSFGVYDGKWKVLLLLYKYSAVQPFVNELTNSLFELIKTDFSKQIDFIVPVPADRGHQRHFDHLLLIGQKLEKMTGISLASDLLIKQRSTPPQAGLSANLRLQNLKNSFALTDPQKLAGKTVLLFDDVFTTGTTLSSCSLLLKRHGAKVLAASILQTN